MNFHQLWAALRAAWWLPVTGFLVGAAIALGTSLLQTPLYSSGTQLFVSTTDSSSTSAALTGSQFSQQRVSSYAQLITGEDLARRVIDRLGLHTTPGQLSSEIKAAPITETVLIDVTVTDPSPRQAQLIARAVGIEFTSYASLLEKPGTGGDSPVKVTVTKQPQLAAAPVSPNPTRNAVLGALIGLLVGAGGAIARARLDRSVKDPSLAAVLAGAPVIGTVLRDDVLAKEHVFDRTATSRTAEGIRQLRTNLQFVNIDEPPKVIMVSSAMPGEGKTTLVLNLALALADAGRTVVVLEGDLRRPKVASYLGMITGVGLTNILAGTADLDDVIQVYGEGKISVVGSGPTPPNPGELLASSHMAALVDKLRGQFDMVLIDAPPLLPVADASGLAAHTDGVLLSVRYGSTRRDHLEQAAKTLERVGAQTLGVILNLVPATADLATAQGYGYEYRNQIQEL